MNIDKNQFPNKDHTHMFENLEYKDIYIENSWIIIPDKLLSLIDSYLQFKKSYGTKVEIDFYENIKLNDFVLRLIYNRPLSFIEENWLLRDKTEGSEDWELIGTNNEYYPLILRDYISYDEILLSSFIGLSIFTPHTNSLQTNAIYIGVSKPCLNLKKLDYSHQIIDPSQNIGLNGYGAPMNGEPFNSKKEYLNLWAKFYDIDYFHTYQEVLENNDGRFKEIDGGFIDTHVQKKRDKIIIELFLKEANYRAKKINKIACCFVRLFNVSTYIEVLSEYNFSNISDVHISTNAKEGFNPHTIPCKVGNVNIHLDDNCESDHNKVLIVEWEYEQNSYPGNKYWKGDSEDVDSIFKNTFITYLGSHNLNEIHHFK